MSTATVSSIESFVAAIEAAEQRLAAGEAQARRAKALLLQAEKARDEAATRKAEAEQQLAPIEEALRKARALRVLVGEEVISQGEALLEQTWTEAQAEVTRLQAEAESAQAEVERLMATPEVRAYLDYRQTQERAEQEARAEEREELQARLAALRPGAAVGQGVEPLADLAVEAKNAGFPNLADQARDAAEAAQQVAKAQAQAERVLRKRQLTRWTERRCKTAQPGDFVFILEEAGNGPGAAVHLRPLPASSGRLRFQVVAALGVENPPDEYSDVPSRGRAWRWRNPPAGEAEGLNEAQAKMVTGIVKGKLRSGWSINWANARLARRPARRTVGERAATDETNNAREQKSVAAASTSPEIETATLPATSSAGDLEGLSPQSSARLRQVGLCTRQVVEDTLAAGDDVFLALPGIGPATLAAVREWLDTSQSGHAEAGIEEQPQAILDATEEAADAEQDEAIVAAETPGETSSPSDGPSTEQAPGEHQPAPTRRGRARPTTVSNAPLVASAVCEGVQPAYQPQPQIPEPAITVEGDDVDGQRLAQWRGVARVGLTPVAQRLGLEEVQVLVHEDEGQSTLVAYWPGGESTLSCPVDGRAGQMRAVRELIQRIQAA
jgi:hypothetical protein